MRRRYSKLLGGSALMFGLSLNVVFAQFNPPAFVTPLPVPHLVDSSEFNLTMDRETHNFNANGAGTANLNLAMPTFAFNHSTSENNSYLGPTMIWHKGDSVTLNIRNNLNVPNATSTAPYHPPTTVHLHGAHVPAWVDGGPHGVIEPNTTRSVKFKVMDDACTLWYHPHGEDETYTQVEMGLAGMIIVDDVNDGVNALLPHTYGVDDFPLIIQDHVFQLLNNGTYAGNIDTARAQAVRTVIVNGVRYPMLDVPAQPVRFRILDGSTRLAYQLGIGTASVDTFPGDTIITPLPFKMIASDGGYLSDSARTATTFLTGVGIRNELVFDFTPYQGQDLYLINMNNVIPPAIISAAGEKDLSLAWMKFHVGAPVGTPGIVPPLPPLVPYDSSLADTVRIKQLIGHGAAPGGPIGFNINNNQYMYDVVDDIVNLDAIEIWRVQNLSGIAHPFHIHDIQFYVTEVRNASGQIVTPLPLEFLGRKDDVLIQAGWSFSFVTQFSDFGNPKPFVGANLDSAAYMYHCHILTHEDGYYAPGNGSTGGSGPSGQTVQGRVDHGMMQQFVVWNGLFTAVNEQEITENLVLFPNPAKDVLNFRGESTVPSKVRVYDLQGRTLLEQDFKAFNGTQSIDLSGISAGMILVDWQSAKGSFTKKVALQ